MTGREIREFSGTGQGRFKGEKALFEKWQEYRFFHLQNGLKSFGPACRERPVRFELNPFQVLVNRVQDLNI